MPSLVLVFFTHRLVSLLESTYLTFRTNNRVDVDLPGQTNAIHGACTWRTSELYVRTGMNNTSQPYHTYHHWPFVFMLACWPSGVDAWNCPVSIITGLTGYYCSVRTHAHRHNAHSTTRVNGDHIIAVTTSLRSTAYDLYYSNTCRFVVVFLFFSNLYRDREIARVWHERVRVVGVTVTQRKPGFRSAQQLISCSYNLWLTARACVCCCRWIYCNSSIISLNPALHTYSSQIKLLYIDISINARH